MGQNTNKPMNVLRNDKYIIVALLLVFGVILKVMIGFHENSHLRYTHNQTIQWRQPTELSTDYYKPISNKAWVKEYSSVEKILWQIKRSSDGKVIINDHTLNLLSQAQSILSNGLKEKELKRLEKVLNKSFIANDGPQLGSLMYEYLKYIPKYTAKLVEINNATGVKKKKLIKEFALTTKKLQKDSFNEITPEDLFGKQNQTINYLNERRLISMDMTLSEKERKSRLEKLQQTFKLASYNY